MTAPISVLLPVRNGAATVGRAVQSTLAALPGNGTLLVHDDASTDETGEVLDAVADERVEVIRSAEPRGVAGGLNILLARVRTPLVARMDADDVCLPWRFPLQRWALERGVDVVFSTVVGVQGGSRRVRPGPPLPITAAAMPLHLLLANPVAHSTMLARTEAISAGGGYRPVPAEDYELWLRLCAAGRRCVRTGAPGILYRFHAHQVTASADWLRRSRADPELARSYALLSERVLGRQPEWYADLGAEAPDEDSRVRLRDFTAAMRSAAAQLPVVQRRFLLRKLGAVLVD